MNPKNNATSQSPKSPTSLPCAILRLCVSARNFLHEHCAQPGRTVDGRKRIWRLSTWKPVERYFAAEKQLDELAVAIDNIFEMQNLVRREPVDRFDFERVRG